MTHQRCPGSVPCQSPEDAAPPPHEAPVKATQGSTLKGRGSPAYPLPTSIPGFGRYTPKFQGSSAPVSPPSAIAIARANNPRKGSE